MTTSVSKQIRQLEKKLNRFSRVDVSRAHSSALNKVMAKAKTQIVRAVSKDVKLQQKFVRKRIYIRKASIRTMRGQIVGYGSAIPLISIVGASSPVRRNGKTGQYKFAGFRVAGKRYDRAFINRVKKNGTLQVLQRKGRARYPIILPKIELYDPMKRDAADIAERLVRTDYQRILISNLNFRIQKYGNT